MVMHGHAWLLPVVRKVSVGVGVTEKALGNRGVNRGPASSGGDGSGWGDMQGSFGLMPRMAKSLEWTASERRLLTVEESLET